MNQKKLISQKSVKKTQIKHYMCTNNYVGNSSIYSREFKE